MMEERQTAMLMKRLLRMEIRRAIALLDAVLQPTPPAPKRRPWSTRTWSWSASWSRARDRAGAQQPRLHRRQRLEVSACSRSGGQRAGCVANAGFTPEQLASFLQVDQVMICKERVRATKTTANLLGGNAVYLFNAQSGAGKDDPSNIKRFVTPMGGGKFKVYRQEITSKLVDITVEHYSNIVCTSTLGIRKRTVS